MVVKLLSIDRIYLLYRLVDYEISCAIGEKNCIQKQDISESKDRNNGTILFSSSTEEISICN